MIKRGQKARMAPLLQSQKTKVGELLNGVRLDGV